MKKISNVKLGINPNTMIVNVKADVEMIDKNDKDDLYLVMFNIMDNPLRLSLFTIGNLFDLVKENTELSDNQINKLMKENPESYIQMAVSNIEAMSNKGVENVKIPLNSEDNAKKARLVLSSMIDKKIYQQISTFKFPDDEIFKEQEISTIELIPQLKMMMEITKRWSNFDPIKFQQDIESGVIKL